MRNQILAAIVTLAAGCGSSMLRPDAGGQSGTGGVPGSAGTPGTGGVPGSAGTPGTGGASAGGAGGTGQAGAAGSTPVAAECAEHPPARAGATEPITINVQLSYAGTPVTFGVPFAIEGGTLTLTNFRFYVSSPALRLRTGGDVPVDLAGLDGTPAPYGVVLVNAEDPAGMAFQIAAPAGDYSGLSFLVGIPDACNGGESGRSAPLSAASQMTWPAPFGYLFLRYAGRRGDGTPAEAAPGPIDMGGFPRHIFAPRVELAADLTVAAARTLRLTVALDQLFRAAGMPADLDEYAQILGSPPGTFGDAQLSGQHVLQNLGAVAAFAITEQP